MTENVNTSSDYLTEDEEYQVNETEYHSRTDQWKIITVFTSVFIWLKSWFVASKAKEPLRRSARYGFFSCYKRGFLSFGSVICMLLFHSII